MSISTHFSVVNVATRMDLIPLTNYYTIIYTVMELHIIIVSKFDPYCLVGVPKVLFYLMASHMHALTCYNLLLIVQVEGSWLTQNYIIILYMYMCSACGTKTFTTRVLYYA